MDMISVVTLLIARFLIGIAVMAFLAFSTWREQEAELVRLRSHVEELEIALRLANSIIELHEGLDDLGMGFAEPAPHGVYETKVVQAMEVVDGPYIEGV